MTQSAQHTPVKNRGWTVTIGATIALLMLGALYAWSVVSQAMGDDPQFADWNEPDLIWPYSLALIFFSVMTAVGAGSRTAGNPGCSSWPAGSWRGRA